MVLSNQSQVIVMAQGRARLDADEITGHVRERRRGLGHDLFTAAVCCQHHILASLSASILVPCPPRQWDNVTKRQVP